MTGLESLVRTGRGAEKVSAAIDRVSVPVIRGVAKQSCLAVRRKGHLVSEIVW